ncbi:putative DNA-directed DNA polymerase, family B [Plasmopara halstedii]
MPSLAYAIQHNEGCFDYCYAMNGNVLAFVRDAIVGGRVMARDNEKHHIQHKLADFDAVSLYPSGQAELDGYIRGKPKWFQNTIPNDADYYIARVKFESIGKKRHFPLLSFYENGARNFTNDIIGKTMIVGKQALEDIIEFQDVKISIMEGVYWNEGFNNQIVLTIKSLFEERLKLKKEGNPLQNGIKLLMNSAYGKLIQKPIVKQKVLVSDEKSILEYTIKNINKMISRTPITDDLALFEEHKALSEHFSPAHLGVQVLDSSKHIMNTVMCLAEDIDAKIWYQDTDSMHIDYDAVSRLADAFRKNITKS